MSFKLIFHPWERPIQLWAFHTPKRIHALPISLSSDRMAADEFIGLSCQELGIQFHPQGREQVDSARVIMTGFISILSPDSSSFASLLFPFPFHEVHSFLPYINYFQQGWAFHSFLFVEQVLIFKNSVPCTFF